MGRLLMILRSIWAPKSRKSRLKTDADGDENLKMAGRGLKEALGMHLEPSSEASRGHDRFKSHLVGGPGPPRKEINLLIL